jgi:TatD DNase family protein
MNSCPYCEVRKTHAGYRFIQTHFSSVAEKKFEAGMTVKNRQEPCHVVQVAEIVAGCKTISIDSVADACYKNSLKLFGWHDE